MSSEFLPVHLGGLPVVAAAIHDGHAIRPELHPYMNLSESERLREEDPYTADWTRICQWRLIGCRSRFEVDFNRPPEKAVYRTPEDSWGLQVWKDPLPQSIVNRSMDEYENFYADLYDLLSELVDQHGQIVVYDLHTYNHRRQGPDSPPADPESNPEINVGTGTMDREQWAPIVERFQEDLRAFDFLGRQLDVRENVRFKGGHFSRWIHETFPHSVCCLPIEVKKFFMDEWTGTADPIQLEAIEAALRSTIPGVVRELRSIHVTV